MTKQLLFSVAGEVPAGALCAVMGPSGSGKLRLEHTAAAIYLGFGFSLFYPL